MPVSLKSSTYPSIRTHDICIAVSIDTDTSPLILSAKRCYQLTNVCFGFVVPSTVNVNYSAALDRGVTIRAILAGALAEVPVASGDGVFPPLEWELCR